MAKLNNAPIGTYKHLFYDKNGNRKKPYNQKYSDEFIINCLKEYYFTNTTFLKLSKKYNVNSGTIYMWNTRFKYGINYRFYRKGGICDQLKGIINLKDYVCLDLPNSRKGKNTGKYQKIKEMYLQGCEYKEIMKQNNVSKGTIKNVRDRFNLPRRRPEYHTLDFMW